MAETRERWRKQLPHWEVRDRPHFVTIRCTGSLPAEAHARLDEIHQALRVIEPHSPQFADLQRRTFLTCEKYLDAGHGFAPFVRANLCTLMVDALLRLESKCGWAVPHFAVMPNHIHLLVQATGAASPSLRRMISLLKGTLAREGNRLLRRSGAFWQAEWFDHWVRDEGEETRIITYIRQNPVKAGLASRWEQYPWVS